MSTKSRTWTPSVDALERLSKLIADGDVVPFVGAGFSIDSEGNTTPVLVQRLLIRLISLGTALPSFAELKLERQLKAVFKLDYDDGGRFKFTSNDVKSLGRQYYETNDWFCSTFQLFFQQARQSTWSAESIAKLAARIVDEEQNLALDIRDRHKSPQLLRLQSAACVLQTFSQLIRLALDATNDGEVEALRAVGKALFLDTMGFRDPAIMGGKPTELDAERVAASYAGRLLPRHDVLARLAREGLCTTTITFNYDLLLEGAFRLTGLRQVTSCADVGEAAADAPRLPRCAFETYARVTSPQSFVLQGKNHRTPVLVKVHGCADSYRDQSQPHVTARALRVALRPMVFTYREIQNWREDSWAADYLRTLLRTRVVVFFGYSLADPVIHDTFRTVYEEMGREHERIRRATVGSRQPDAPTRSAAPTAPPATSQEAPAFFFTPVSEADQFYGSEILQAASSAIGVTEHARPHPNRISFWFRGEEYFPSLDECLKWLSHRTQRHQQRRALETDFRRTVSLTLSRPRPARQLERLEERIHWLHNEEDLRARGWDEQARSRHSFARLSSFSEFTSALLREFATIDLLQQRGQPYARIVELRNLSWHYPVSEDARWTCWAAVVELALRRMVAKAFDGDPLDPDLVWAARAPAPTILFRAPGQAPNALTIHLADFEPLAQLQRFAGNPVRHCFWQLSASHFPRAGEPPPAKAAMRSGNRTIRAAAPANLLFDWAAQDDHELSASEARDWLGLEEAPANKTARDYARPVDHQ